MDDKRPEPQWVYRGQSTKGIGEGPGQHVSHGDQYLDASAALKDVKLLEAIRPWMTLDSDPIDHERLKDGLEAWSCFRASGRQFVARLVSAGIYDRRAAYFSQGFAWSVEALRPPGFDPGLFLGRSEAFEKPWRDREPGKHAPDLERVGAPPSLPRPRDVEGSSQAAVSFLAHLFQACVLKRSLIIAAPVAEFAFGSPLHALVSFARGALPAGLKRDCSVRVYTRTPELFLGHLKATMLAVPEEVASQALGVRRDAILLDRSGGRLAGPAAEPPAVQYAEAVLKRALRIPEGLGLFSERFEARFSPRGLPDAQSVRAVEPTYNLAVALAGSAEDRKDLLLHYLPKVAQWLGPGEIWNRLITPGEWAAFPPDALQALLLRDLSSMPAGARELQETVERILAGQGWRLDARLDEWWDGGDPGKVRKLVELLERKLVTPAAVASRTSRLPLRCLPDGGVAHAALAAEMRENVLSSRSADPGGLADLAADEKVFSLLAEAVRKETLDAGWARELLQRTEEAGLIPLARRLLQIQGFLFPGRWGDLPRQVLDRLCGRELPRDLGGLLFTAGKDLQPAADPGLYLRLVEAFGATLPSDSENGLASRLLADLPSKVVEDDFSRFFRILDRLMVEKPRETTRALVESGWWHAWRREPRLDPDRLRTAAVDWFTCDAWAKGREAHLETWKIVLADLPSKLEEKALERRSWPWIPPFEEEQLGNLARRAADLGALAALTEAIRNEPCFRGTVAHVLVLRSSGCADTFDEPAILSWLMSREPEGLPALDLAHSSLLYEQAGQRRPQALLARRRSVEEALEKGRALEALEAAGKPDLWNDPDFVTAVANWMCRRGSLAEIGDDAARLIDAKVACEPSRPPQAPARLVQELSGAGYGNAAGLFGGIKPEADAVVAWPGEPVAVEDPCIRALVEKSSDHPCWSRLGEQVHAWIQRPGRRSAHPVCELAARVRMQPREVQSTLNEHGWATFAAATQGRPSLLDMGADFTGPLPVFELAASLRRPGALGRAAVEVVQLEGHAPKRNASEWWRALVRGIGDWRRWEGARSADDRRDLALSTLCKGLRGMDQFDRERELFSSALEKENLTPGDWSDATMSKRVSFFYPRGQSPAETYEFTLTIAEPKETYRLFVHAHERLRRDQVRDGELSGRSQLDAAVEGLKESLQAKGGLIVILNDSAKEGPAARFHPIGGQPPSTFLVVEPARPPRLVALGESWQRIPAGRHLVCPVDGRSEEQLRDFVGNLSWFPEDFESLVLYALVRPNLEERVSELERSQFRKAPKPGTTAGGIWNPDGQWSMKEFLIGSALAAALGLLVGLSFSPVKSYVVALMAKSPQSEDRKLPAETPGAPELESQNPNPEPTTTSEPSATATPEPTVTSEVAVTPDPKRQRDQKGGKGRGDGKGRGKDAGKNANATPTPTPSPPPETAGADSGTTSDPTPTPTPADPDGGGSQ